MGSHKPLRVRAILRAPVVADEYLPLDGILFYQVMRDEHGPQIITVPGSCLPCHEETLPLAVANSGTQNWYYCCSWAQWSHDVEGRDYWNKRFDSRLSDLVDFGGRRGKVLIEQGRYKAYHMPVFYRAALWIDWWCVGDRERIEYLLLCCTHVGKKAAQGWGRVIRWEIESAPEDWSVWRDGKLMRGIPDDSGGAHIQHYGVRPSYWLSANQMMLVMPNG